MTCAERARRHRERQRRGVEVLAVEIGALDFAEAAAVAGIIANPDTEDRAELAAAAAIVLRDFVERFLGDDEILVTRYGAVLRDYGTDEA